jgi:hypothetical protein
MSPPRWSMLAETGDHSPFGKKLAAIVASPTKNKKWRSTYGQHHDDYEDREKERIADRPRYRISLAASGAARKTAQSSETSRTVRLGSLIRSYHAGIDLSVLSVARNISCDIGSLFN